MNSPANQLPNDVEALKALVLDLQAKQQQQHRKEQQYQKRINHLEEEIRLMLQKRFGASSRCSQTSNSFTRSVISKGNIVNIYRG